MTKSLINYLLILFSAGLLFACGESDSPQQSSPTENFAEAQKSVETSTTEIAKVEAIEEVPVTNEVQEMVAEASNKADETIASVTDQAKETMDELKASAEEKVTEVVAAATSDKPYQLIDGAISANAVEGWKTYNGGGCGACHGKGGKGGVGPNLGLSVTEKLSKDEFVNIVANGKSGTLMRPNKNNKRVMDNMDNLYAYLVARGDGVLGEGNLIKLPLGK